MSLEGPITRSDLAELCGVSRQTILAWEHAGAIPAGERHSGRETRFEEPAVLLALAYAEARS